MTVLSCHRGLINNGVEKMNYIKYRIEHTRCLLVRVNIGIQTIYNF
jgi:hypothetical protein